MTLIGDLVSQNRTVENNSRSWNDPIATGVYPRVPRLTLAIEPRTSRDTFMPTRRSATIASVVAIAALALAGCGDEADVATSTDAATSDDAASTIDSLTVDDAWFRTSTDELGSAYLTVANDSNVTVTLLSVSSAVGTVELHETVTDDAGVMKMEPRPGGFVIEPGGLLTLEPGGKHLMLTGFASPAPDPLALTLQFDAGTLEVSARFDETASATSTSHTAEVTNHDHPADDTNHDDDTQDDHLVLDSDLATYGLDVQALHELELELDGGTIEPGRQLQVVEAALAAISSDDWPAALAPGDLESDLRALIVALEAGDVDGSASAASAAHDAAHELEHQAEHSG